MDVDAALAMYTKQLDANGRSPHTRAQYERHLRRLGSWMEAALGTRAIEALTHEHIAGYLTSDEARLRPDGEPKTASSVNVLRSSLRSFFEYCTVAGWIGANPARLVRRAVVGEPVPRALSEREVGRLREAWSRAATPSEKRDRVLFELLLGTGLRIGSALGLEAGDVDLEERRLWVRVAKRGRQQVVGFDERVEALLREHIGDRTSGFVFESSAGQPLTPRSAQRRLVGWVRKAGIRRAVSQHQLRHTFATQLYDRTRDIEQVRVALNHASLAVTSRYSRYAADAYAR